MLIALCDGACSGNPGPASIGVVLWERFQASHRSRVSPNKVFRESIGVGTNNDAEWRAVLYALRYVVSHERRDPAFIYTDSQLVAFQANGKWKVRGETMKGYKGLFDSFMSAARNRSQEVTVTWVPRQMTFLADREAAKAVETVRHSIQ